jgi:hypothetical protein
VTPPFDRLWERLRTWFQRPPPAAPEKEPSEPSLSFTSARSPDDPIDEKLVELADEERTMLDGAEDITIEDPAMQKPRKAPQAPPDGFRFHPTLKVAIRDVDSGKLAALAKEIAEQVRSQSLPFEFESRTFAGLTVALEDSAGRVKVALKGKDKEAVVARSKVLWAAMSAQGVLLDDVS